MSAPIEIVDYDALWPGKFAEERELLLGALGAWLRGSIEHVGSTAVPGLRAKPVIDIMVGVESLPASREAIPALKDELAARYRDDREAYTDGKTDFVRGLVALELRRPPREPG